MRYLLISSILFFSTFLTLAQSQITLSGTVLDSVSKEPLSFAYVTIEGVALGTVTNGEGEFAINLPSIHQDKRILFSYLGYRRKTYPISDLMKQKELVVYLEEDVTQLNAVIIKPRKKISAKQLLKKVIKNIEINYAQTPTLLSGYYRETVRENGAFISYADAVSSIHYTPYQEKEYKFSDYRIDALGSINSLNNTNMYNGKSLHRGHFHSKTTKNDQAKVIDSRSSNNLTKTDMIANIQAGPMGLFSKDYLKYKAAFFSEKKFKKFDYELGEVLIDGVGYVYVLSFKTKLTKELMEKIKTKGRLRPYYKAHRNKVLQGKIYIHRDDFAVLKFESSVPNDFKQYFCSYTTMNYKHFDYKLNIEYQKIGDQYHLKYLRHEDEFILKDTLSNTTTPYVAVSQFWIDNVKTEAVEKFDLTETFANIATNQLFDLPLEYNVDYWVNYSQKNSIANIPDSIRKDLEVDTPLEKQFADKHKRNDSLKPPIAQKIPVKTTIHKTTLTDNYAWMKQPKNPLSNPDIKKYLIEENKYTDNYFIPLRQDQRELFTELTSRVDKEDESIPYEKDGYWYQTKWTEDDDYPIYLRRKEDQKEYDTLMNVNTLAEGKDYYSAGGLTISPSTQLMAYYENTTGSDKSIVKFKNINQNQSLKDSLMDIAGLIWLNDSQLIYTKQEPKTNRVFQVKVHTLFTSQQNDSLVFQENDPRFQVSLSKSKSKEYLFMNVGSSNTNEMHLMKINAPEEGFKMIAPRSGTHQYSVSHYKDDFYIFSNRNNPDFEIYKCNKDTYRENDWKLFMKPKKGIRFTDFVMFDNYLVIGETEKMQNRIKVINKASGKSHYIKMKGDIYNIYTSYNPKFDSDTLRFSFNSMKVPSQVWNYHMETKEKRLVKKQVIKNFFAPFWIKQKRVWATAKDGTEIPITLLYSSYSANKNNQYKRLYMSAYGSYGSSSTPGFNHTIYSLVNRGFVYAIPHVRGGGEMGQRWHDGGKMMNKMNTFTDFIDCAEYLIEEGYATKGNIVAEGGSAGGLLMGAIANMRPDLFKMIILDVPFVDVMNTMLDEKLPLTTIEYEEWGNPNEKKAFNYMLSYSPYDNVKEQDYPHMLFTTGVNDTRVGYWEPAKMVAKLRQMKTDDNLLLLKTNLYAGHGGGSSRFDGLKELAYKYAIIFDIFANDIQEEAAEKAKTASQ